MKKNHLFAAVGLACGLASLGSVAQAQTAAAPANVPAECSFELNADDTMRFTPVAGKNSIVTDASGASTMTITKASCPTVKVTLHNIGSVPKESMGHNWVLVETPNFMPIATEVTTGQVTAATDYLVPNDPRVIAHTLLSGPGESHEVVFSTDKLNVGGDYTFFCNFPGHFATMNGKFIVK